MIQIPITALTLIGSIIAIGGTMFGIFFYFQNPQIVLEKRIQILEDNDREQDKTILTLKNDNLKNNEDIKKDMKDLTVAINGLNITVAKLETIINERIPKGSPSLTPIGH